MCCAALQHRPGARLPFSAPDWCSGHSVRVVRLPVSPLSQKQNRIPNRCWPGAQHLTRRRASQRCGLALHPLRLSARFSLTRRG